MSDTKTDKTDKTESRGPLASLGTALIVIVSFTVAISLAYSFGSLSAKNAELNTHIEYRDKEIEYLRGQVTTLQAQLMGKSAENEALETKLGLMPDPSVPVPDAILQASRRNVLALVDDKYQKRAYQELIAISYVETKHRAWLVGALGEKSNFQIMPFHHSAEDKGQEKEPDVGARYALKVLSDFNAIEDPKRIWRYNGAKSYLGLIVSAHRLHFNEELL